MARDLQAHKGACVVIAGRASARRSVHALAHAMNEALGNVGKTVTYTEPVEARPERSARVALQSLVKDMRGRRGRHAGDPRRQPVYDAPADLEFQPEPGTGRACGFTSALYEDETAALCHWHVPQAHDLEAWGDARAADGTATIMQPLIAPLYGGKSAHEPSGRLPEASRTGATTTSSATTGAAASRDDFETSWRKAVHDGVVPGTAAKPKTVEPEGRGPINWSCRTRSPRPTSWSSSSGPTRRSGTAGSPTTAGSRNCPSR